MADILRVLAIIAGVAAVLGLIGVALIYRSLKRLNVPLDRDVIFLAEAGEEGSTRVGIQFMVNQHFGDIDAEYCLAETGGMVREGEQFPIRRPPVRCARPLR